MDLEILKQRLESVGSLRRLAADIGVSHGTVDRWLHGCEISPMGKKMWRIYLDGLPVEHRAK